MQYSFKAKVVTHVSNVTVVEKRYISIKGVAVRAQHVLSFLVDI
jgi:hypothetical protein